jgi:two-component sensor histidine kinase
MTLVAGSQKFPLPDNEDARLAAVRRYDILDTPPDGAFDRITAIAARLFDVPIAIISIVDNDRIWFKSHHGLDVEQIDRAPGLCASAILQPEPWILLDAKTDPRSLANPLVASEFGLRFYVGVPLRTGDGHHLGTLCVIDKEPRTVSEDQIEHLKDLAAGVIDHMELRLAARRAVSKLEVVIEEKDAALRRSRMMAKEIDHRVMNSLQMVSSLLKLQGRGLDDAEATGELTMAASRVAAVARVHQHIYMSDTVDTTDCAGYLTRLCEDLSAMLLSDGREAIVVDAIAADLPTEQIAPLGLITNELVTNAAKHGQGRITVTFDREGPDDYALQVFDEGNALPDGFDPMERSGLGMRVIKSLTAQLGGEFVVAPSDDRARTIFTVRFPRQQDAKQH